MKSKKITDSQKQQISDIDRCCDKNTFAVCGKNFLKIFNLSDKDCIDIKTTCSRVPNPTIVRFHPKDSEIIVSVNTNPPNIILMNRKKGLNEYEKIGKHERQITGASWNFQKSQLLATCSIDQTIKIWDTNNRKTKTAMLAPDPIISIENKEHLRDCQFSPFDENYLLCCGDGGSVFLYDIRKYNKEIVNYNSECQKEDYSFQQMEDKVQSLCWHPTKRNIFCTGGMDQFIHIWDVNQFNPIQSLKASEGVTKVRFMKNNPDLIIVALYQLNNFCTSIWNVNNKYMPEYIYSGHKDRIISFVCDNNEKRLLTLCKDGNVNVYNLNSEIKIPNFDSGKRVLDNITTNVIKFTENNELYCYHENPMIKTSFNNTDSNNFNSSNNLLDKLSIVDNLNFENHESSNNISNISYENNNSDKDKTELNENEKKIYMLNFNQKEMQSENKNYKNKGVKDIKIQVNNNTFLTLDCKLQQFYFFTSRQIKNIFTEYKIILDLPEGALKFENVHYNKLIPSEKIKKMLENNLKKAESTLINNYNHISIWKQLIFLVEQDSFKKIVNKPIENKKKRTQVNIEKDDLKFIGELMKKHILDIIEYLIEVHGDIYLAAIIGYMFQKLIATDKKGIKRLIRLQTDCYTLLIKLKLFREANYLKKYGQNLFEKKNEKSDNGADSLENFKYCFSCDCGGKYCPSKRKNKDGTYEQYGEFGQCKCGKILACEICKKKVLGLFVWCPGCGHGGHLKHMTDLLDKNETCTRCGHRCK